MHSLLLRLVSLRDGGVVACAEGDLAVLLDESAAQAAVRGAAVGAARALDVVSLADLASLDHVVAAREE